MKISLNKIISVNISGCKIVSNELSKLLQSIK